VGATGTYMVGSALFLLSWASLHSVRDDGDDDD
jgi:hypothetical protein